MTLKQIEAFYWAATSASFLIAAKRLHLSLSSLSKRINELEVQLGRPLFDRSGHKAMLSEAGEMLLPQARRLLNVADELRSVMADKSSMRGHCRFGVGESTALTWLPDLVALARRTYPDLVLEPCVDIGPTLEQQVDDGMLDFAVVAGRSPRSAIASQPIGELPFHWTGAKTLVGANTEINAEALRKFAVITMPQGAGATRAFDTWLATNNFEVGRRLICNSMAAIAGLVVAGVGVGYFPGGWLRQMSEHKVVVTMRSNPPLPPVGFFLQWRRDDTRPVISRLRELVLQVVDFSKPAALW
jgi:DNA-binding transcriptional LysR family regulator